MGEASELQMGAGERIQQATKNFGRYGARVEASMFATKKLRLVCSSVLKSSEFELGIAT